MWNWLIPSTKLQNYLIYAFLNFNVNKNTPLYFLKQGTVVISKSINTHGFKNSLEWYKHWGKHKKFNLEMKSWQDAYQIMC